MIHLHSSEPQSHDWNFQSTAPILTLRCQNDSHITTLRSSTRIEQQWNDPLTALQWMAAHPIPRAARWVGYLSYDLGRLFEPLPAIAKDDLHLPLFSFALHEEKGSEAFYYNKEKAYDPFFSAAILPQSSLSKGDYLTAAARAIDFIRAGDVFQVNLSQRFHAPLWLDPKNVWQNLLDHTPAPYGAFMDFGDHQILSNSPELFLRVDRDRRIITRPIKGTRPRAPGMEADLLHSQKDQAELNMIIDLERNDLGRVCETGSVRVTQPRTIEAHPTVYHGVATVEGQLKPDVTFVNLLRATFPGGSITGAPKIRAMQIIEQLEPVRRGPYCGAIGYLAGDGSMQFNVAIRTIIIKNQQAFIPVGGGIVADSDPAAEYEETIVKAAAMFRALNVWHGRSAGGTPM
jgi:aminodeoxychorismate synthase component I